MSFDFLVPISTYPDATPEAGLRRALDLAATMSGRITALVQEIDIPPLHNLLAEAVIDLSALAARTEAASKVRGAYCWTRCSSWPATSGLRWMCRP